MFSLFDERYTCYPSEFDSGDVVSKCVVIAFFMNFISLLQSFLDDSFMNLINIHFKLNSFYYSGGVEKDKGTCLFIAF